MARGGSRLAMVTVVAAASSAWPAGVLAQDVVVEPTPPAPETAPEAAPEPAPAPPSPPRRWSLGVNPLAFLLGRFGGDAEYLLAKYVVLVGNLHVDASAVFTSTSTNPYWGFGGEAGIRLYPTSHTLYGFFFGPSLVAGWYSINYYGQPFALPDVGFAFDSGGTVRAGKSGFVTLGVGLQHLSTRPYPLDIASIVSFVIGSGWAPRLLLTIGTTFP